MEVEIIEKNDIKNEIEKHSKLTFNGVHKSYTKCGR